MFEGIERASTLTLPNVAFARLKSGNNRVEFLNVLAGSGFEFCSDIDLIAKLTCARAKFSKIAHRGRPSLLARSNLLIEGTHGYFRVVMSAAKHACPRDDA
jgi:hypothetical protein